MSSRAEAPVVAAIQPWFVVGPIEPNEARTAYPLMQAADPSLSLAQWLRYTRRVATRRYRANEGILLARRLTQPHPCGVVCYRVEHSLGCGLVLTAEHLVALDLLCSEAIQCALMDALDDLAIRLGCTATRLIGHGIRPKLLDQLGRGRKLTEAKILTRSIPHWAAELPPQ